MPSDNYYATKNMSELQSEKSYGNVMSPKSIAIFIISLAIVVVVVLAVIASTGLNIKMLSNGSYKYSFEFNKDSSLVKLADGSSAYKSGNNVIAQVTPSKGPALSNCAQIGKQ